MSLAPSALHSVDSAGIPPWVVSHAAEALRHADREQATRRIRWRMIGAEDWIGWYRGYHAPTDPPRRTPSAGSARPRLPRESPRGSFGPLHVPSLDGPGGGGARGGPAPARARPGRRRSSPRPYTQPANVANWPTAHNQPAHNQPEEP
jgi:hypothetical protein